MITIRRAELTDSPWLLTQLKAFAQFFGSKHSLFPSDDAGILDALHSLVETKVFLVAEANGKSVGFIAGLLQEHPYNPKITVLSELFWWVAPEHQGSSAGARLLQAFTDYGRLNAQWIVMTLETKSPVNPRSLEKRGFRHFESSYLLETC